MMWKFEVNAKRNENVSVKYNNFWNKILSSRGA
jgi:hypothetical protein